MNAYLKVLTTTWSSKLLWMCGYARVHVCSVGGLDPRCAAETLTCSSVFISWGWNENEQPSTGKSPFIHQRAGYLQESQITRPRLPWGRLAVAAYHPAVPAIASSGQRPGPKTTSYRVLLGLSSKTDHPLVHVFYYFCYRLQTLLLLVDMFVSLHHSVGNML